MLVQALGGTKNVFRQSAISFLHRYFDSREFNAAVLIKIAAPCFQEVSDPYAHTHAEGVWFVQSSL